MTDEDLYVYITAHEWKHFVGCGTGLRSLADIYVFLKKKKDSLDWNYIIGQVNRLGMGEFEEMRRMLALKLFSGDGFPALNDEEESLLGRYLQAGTYGTYENGVKNKLESNNGISFWKSEIFIPLRNMEVSVPATRLCPVLLYPFGVLWRIIRVLLFRRKKLRSLFRVIRKTKIDRQ